MLGWKRPQQIHRQALRGSRLKPAVVVLRLQDDRHAIVNGLKDFIGVGGQNAKLSPYSQLVPRTISNKQTVSGQIIAVLKGHGFSRAERSPKNYGLQPLRDDLRIFNTSLGG